jgi:hypothetical protein
MNYVQLYQAIQDYAENTESLFVSNIPLFVQEAEKRIYNSVQIPSLRKNVVGLCTANNKYLSLPNDWLSTYSIAMIDNDGRYTYLLNKDVNFIREAYPSPTSLGLPKYYAVFGPNTGDFNELSALFGPTPDDDYSVELHYYYYPVSIVQGQIISLQAPVGGTSYTTGVYANIPLTYVNNRTTGGSGATATIVVSAGSVTQVILNNGGSFYNVGDVLTTASTNIGGSGTGFSVTVDTITNIEGTSWLGDNYDPVLFYGSMREAIIFMKGEQDMVTYYEKMYQDAIAQLKRLGDGLERGDAYRDGQTKLKVNS